MRRTIPTALAALSAAALLAACTVDEGNTETTVMPTEGGTETGTETATETGDAAGGTGAVGDTGTRTDDAATTAAVSDDPVCMGFFTATGNAQTLAERADTQREAITGGDVTDQVSYSEVTLLESRISALVDDGEGEDANLTLLERVNAPFEEVRLAVTDGEAADTEDEAAAGAISLPEIDVSDSAQAQDELEAACTS